MKGKEIYMTKLNKKETESYIHEEYANESYQENKILTDDVIEKIYLMSAGNKDVIDTICKQYLHDPATKKEEIPNYLISMFFQLIGESLLKFCRLGSFGLIKFKEKILKKFAVVLGFLIIMFTVIFNFFPSSTEYTNQILSESKKEDMKTYRKYNIDLPENKKTKVRDDKLPRLLSSNELMKEFSSLQEPIVDELLPQQLEDEITVSVVTNTNNHDKSNETQDLDLEVKAQIQSEKDDNSVDASKKSSIATNNGINIESNKKTKNFKKDISWLVNQHSDKYVLQLVSAIKKETIINYLAFFVDTNESIIEFTASISGQKRYILLYGPFDNRDLAYAQIEKLPQKARQTKPWVRTIKSIKELVE